MFFPHFLEFKNSCRVFLCFCCCFLRILVYLFVFVCGNDFSFHQLIISLFSLVQLLAKKVFWKRWDECLGFSFFLFFLFVCLSEILFEKKRWDGIEAFFKVQCQVSRCLPSFLSFCLSVFLFTVLSESLFLSHSHSLPNWTLMLRFHAIFS